MPSTPEHFDVLIVGAGLSGVGAAVHLQRDCPGKTYAILEARPQSGGTWDLFRYPGIRSDSDMFTLGYAFKPWTEAKAIADGPSILRYIRETAREHGVEQKIRYSQRVVRAEWSSADARWTVTVEHADGDTREQLTCSFLYGNTGYYNYAEGFTPQFEGVERFRGEVVHPQHWPEQLDYAGKRVVVIGSGATAVTLVPAMVEGGAAHVTMLQRSPTYIVALPGSDPIADFLRKRLPARAAYAAVRWKNVVLQAIFYQLSRRVPRFMRRVFRRGVERELPVGYDIDTHFTPTYDPWDQRVCLVPDADLFRAIAGGGASVVTDRIETFTERGLQLASGQELEADVIITATGINLQLLGGMTVAVDGEDVDLSACVGYKGIMFSGVPNAAVTLGYTNASWTLKADLCAEYVCRLLNHMDAHGHDIVTPRAPAPGTPTHPLIDLRSGYVLRAVDALPKQGDRTPWRLHQNYALDILMMRRGAIADDGLAFARADALAAGSAADAGEPVAV
jgi:monooxygenase